MSIIKAVGLKKYYVRGSETVKALDGVDFEIKPEEIVSIVGPSGSGKTTLMNLISCLDVSTDGYLEISGLDVSDFKETSLVNIRRKSIGFVFQQFYLIPTLTVKENIELPLIFSKKYIDEKYLDDLLLKVGLKGKENMGINMLNGGDKQRVAVARALVNNPDLIIADEPTGRLTVLERDKLLDVFMGLARSGIAIFIATHDLDLASKTERVLYLQDGRLVKKTESSLYL